MTEPLATHEFTDGGLEAALAFLSPHAGRSLAPCGWSAFRRVGALFDINGEYFEPRGLGYPDADIAAVLNSFNTPFDPESIREPVEAEYKEFKTGRRYPWAADRVM